MVFFATPVTRTVARMLMPSHKHATTCPRRSVLNLFILTIIRDRSGITNREGNFSFNYRPRIITHRVPSGL